MLGRTIAFIKRQHHLHLACVLESLAELKAGYKQTDKKQCVRKMFARRFWGWWLLLAFLMGISIALSLYHEEVVVAIRPVTQKILDTKGSWAVPVVALIVVSIPPLAGHELIILIVGVVWGLAWGFVIAIAGTWLGEILVFYLFRYFFQEKAKKVEQKSKMYSSLAEIMRKDGLWMVAMVRFSAIPGHVTTAIQSCIGISIWTYGIAAAISLPKQLCLVYLGVLFGQSQHLPAEASDPSDTAAADSKRKHTILTWTILCITGWLTFMAFYIIWFRIWYTKRQAEAAKADAATVQLSSEVLQDSDMTEIRYGNSKPFESPSLEYFTTASSGNRTPAPSYRETMGEMYPKSKTSNSSLGSTLSPRHPGRSRSSTLVSLAFNNNSLPYLPYTPMLELPSQLPLEGQRMPSPVPAAVVPSSPRLDLDSDIERLAGENTTAEQPSRLRRVRLSRSNSNLTLPAGSGEGRSQPPSPMLELAPRSRSQTRLRASTITSLPGYSAALERGISSNGLPTGSPLPPQIPEADEDQPKDYFTVK